METKQPFKRSDFNYAPMPKSSGAKLETIQNIQTNLVRIKINDQSSQQYSLSFDPAIDKEQEFLKKVIIKQLTPELNGRLEKFFLAGDTLFSPGNNKDDLFTLKTTVKDTEYKVTVNKTSNHIDLSAVKDNSKESIKFKSYAENILKQVALANPNLLRFDDAYLDAKKIDSLGKFCKSQIMHGFSTAAVITSKGICLRINDKVKVLPNKTVLEKIREMCKAAGKNSPSEYESELASYFKGRKVVARYGTPKVYELGEIFFDRTVENTTIEFKTGTKVTTKSLFEYYKTTYNITIKDKSQPIFKAADNKRVKAWDPNKPQSVVFLIPELIEMQGNSDLTEKEKAEVIRVTKYKPAEKAARITKCMNYLVNDKRKEVRKKGSTIQAKSPKEIKNEWHLEYDNDFVVVSGKMLELPKISFSKKTQTVALRNGRFQQQEILCPVDFNTKNTICLTWDVIVSQAKKCIDSIVMASKNLGINFTYPTLQKLKSKEKNSVITEMRGIDYNNGKNMVLCILDMSTKYLYKPMKEFLYTQAGITSQFMVYIDDKKKRNLSYFSQVLNQMVVKAKGELFRLEFPKNFADTPSMIIGIEGKNAGAGKMKYVMSSSYNRFYNKFFSDMEIGGSKEDPAAALGILLRRALDNFKHCNKGVLPQKIIAYRAGGNERQNFKAANFELPIIKDIFGGSYEKNYKPQFAIFTVNKNSDLKFFEKSGKFFTNLKPGTVIDSQIVTPGIFEYYLQCPEVDNRAGTGLPVHHLCLYNDIDNLCLEDFEKIAYNQSYYYWNWPGPIRTPAALRFAEQLSMFSTRYLSDKQGMAKLQDAPYYI